jgi:5-formyltetrahydrofolate cyclo-ligase
LTDAAASSAVRSLLALPQYRAAQRLSVYLSMPTGEISTTEIVRDAMNAGKQVFVPYTYQVSQKVGGQPSSIMDMVELKSFEDFQGFKADKWGIPTPSEDSIAERRNSFGGTGKSEGQWAQSSRGAGLDLIVVPGMAFDRNMGRLGHGKGYYDYFLGRCHSQSAQGQTKMPFLGKQKHLNL